MASALLFTAALLLRLCACRAQVPVPETPPGFTIGRGNVSAEVQLEAFIDLLCPFSKAAYSGVKALADHYEPKDFRVKMILFPLPFHQHGFTAAQSAFTVTLALGDDQFTPWLEAFFWNEATKDMSVTQVKSELKGLAQKTFPSLTDKQWEEGMTNDGDDGADHHARVMWKYACTRAITGTPQYILNGVPFKGADSSWKLDDWLKVIDPLVKADRALDG
uniref:Thioredoxin-like fold domain-containing protein n=1 Tax=Hyaloperonospora arabidopsidis (strain Emoy2) TaxID=559515 RepID=M4B3S1_HYAAE